MTLWQLGASHGRSTYTIEIDSYYKSKFGFLWAFWITDCWYLPAHHCTSSSQDDQMSFHWNAGALSQLSKLISMSILVFNVEFYEWKLKLARPELMTMKWFLSMDMQMASVQERDNPPMYGKLGVHLQVDFNIPDHKCVCSLDLPLNECIFLIPYLINDINYFYMSLFCIYLRIQF